MTPDDRRAALIDATLPLLLAHGRTVTSKQIAEAAGVAEGTIFRVFDSKDDLITAALDHAFDVEPFLVDLQGVDHEQPLRELVTDLVTLLQHRFQGIFELMTAVGMVGPPSASAKQQIHRNRQEGARIMADLLAPHADQLAVPVEDFVHITRLLTFSGSHPHLADGRILTADAIVTTVLDGLLSKES